MTSPDTFASLELDVIGDDRARAVPADATIREAWHISAGTRPGSPHRWQLAMSSLTPAHLVRAVTRRLADRTPVLRERHQIPHEHRPHVTLRDPNTPAITAEPGQRPALPGTTTPTTTHLLPGRPTPALPATRHNR
jgi:hypothetical protein